MTENKRFILEDSDYDLKYEFRIADLSRVKKTKEDFWHEKGFYMYIEFINYLYEHNAFLTKDEADNILNELADENKQLKQFKFNTLKLIDKNIKKYQNHLEDVEDDAVCPERYIWEIKGHLQALTELKEALNE